MEYKLINDPQGNNATIRLTTDDGNIMFIPFDPANTDYQEYLEWTKASPMNVAEPADEVTE
jgi:hypothetical protein